MHRGRENRMDKSLLSRSALVNLSLWGTFLAPLSDPMDCSLPGSSSVHGNSPGKNTGVGCHAFLQGIFPTQGSNQVSQIAGTFFSI